MGQQIIFFKKNTIDLDSNNVTITVTDAVATNDGSAFVDYMRNRKNDSGWLTTGSTDAANTTLVFDMSDEESITDILVIGHNLKAYTIKYWNGSTYVDFSTAISETTNTATTNHYNFNSVDTSRIQLIITGTQIADADKVIRQFIITRKIGNGQLEGWPEIKSPTISLNRKSNKMLSGKISLVESIESYSAKLSVKSWSNDNDMDLIEELYFAHRGVLYWPCGGDEDQFSTVRIGYRLQDIYLVRPTNEYSPEYNKGVYTSGLKMSIDIKESVS